MFFAKNIGKNMSNKYSQKFFDSAKKSATDAIKIALKREIQKQTLSKIKYHNKLTSASKNNSNTDENEIEIPKERHISPEKRQQFIDELILV